MEDILQYILSLSSAGNKLKSIGINTDSALTKFADLEKKSNHLSKEFLEMGSSIGMLKKKIDFIREEKEWIPASNVKDIQSYNREINKLEKQISKLDATTGKSKLKTWAKDAFNQSSIAGLIKNPLALAGNVLGKSMQLGMEADSQKLSFDVLLNSEEASKKMVADLAEYGAGTPYEKMGLGEAAKQMLSLGMAQEEVIPTLKLVGEVAMGDANKLSTLTAAYSEMFSTGKLTEQGLAQMVSAGFNPLAEISRKTGRSMSDLEEEMKTGAISAQMVEGAFVSATAEGGSFHGVMDKVNNSVSGKLTRSMNLINDKILQLYQVISPLVSVGLDAFVWILDKASFVIEGLVNGITWLIDGAINLDLGATLLAIAIGFVVTSMVALKAATLAQVAITTVISGITKIWTAVQWALNAAMLANPIGLIIAAIIALIALIVACIKKYEEWGAAILFLMGPIGLLVNAIMALKNNWDSIKEAFSSGGILGGLKRIGIVLLDAVLYPVQQLLSMLAKIPGLSHLAGKGADKLAQIRKNLNLVDPEGKTASQLDTAVPDLTDSSKTLDLTEGIRKQFEATIPGLKLTPPTSKYDNDTGDTSETDKTNEAIATGGTKNTTINIQMANMVETIQVSGRDFKEAASNIQQEVENAMLRVLAMATTTAG